MVGAPSEPGPRASETDVYFLAFTLVAWKGYIFLSISFIIHTRAFTTRKEIKDPATIIKAR